MQKAAQHPRSLRDITLLAIGPLGGVLAASLTAKPFGEWLSTISPVPAAAGMAGVVAVFLLGGLLLPLVLRGRGKK